MMVSRFRGQERWTVIAAGAVLAVLLVMIVLSPHHLIYDEEGNQVGARYMAAGHSFWAMLHAPAQMLAGPFFSVLQWALSPLTGFAAPAVRLINPVLLVMALGALWQTLRFANADAPLARACALLGVPLLPLSTGLALTEVLPLTLAAIAIVASAWAMTGAADAPVRRWGGFVAAGVAAGLATLARQPYLCATAGFILIALAEPRWRWPAGLAALVALLIPAPVFAAWGGLVAPIGVGGLGGLAPAFGAHGLAYLALIVLLLVPRFYGQAPRASLVGLAAGTIAVLILGTGGLHVASGPAARLPAALRGAFELAAPAVLIGGGGALAAAGVVHLWTRRDDRLFVLMMLLTLGMAITPMAIAMQFSSRYVLAAFPFAVLAIQPFYRPGLWAAARLVLGALIGIASLAVMYTY